MFHNKTVIIVIAILVLAGVGYAVFSGDSKPTTSTGVTKQAVSKTTTSSGATLQEGPGKEFVTQLLAIQNITFNLDFFVDSVFLGLRDSSKELIPEPIGRPNPFAPIGDSSRADSPETTEEAISNVTAPARAGGSR